MSAPVASIAAVNLEVGISDSPLGPDGFCDTPEHKKARTEMLINLCRDFNFDPFKIDAIRGQLRRQKQEVQKQEALVKMVKECQKYYPYRKSTP